MKKPSLIPRTIASAVLIQILMEKFNDVAIFLKFGDKRLNIGAVKEELLWKRDERFIGHG
jgi:hypothetical protein